MRWRNPLLSLRDTPCRYWLSVAIGRLSAASLQEAKMKKKKIPPGWDEERVRKVLAHYDEQSEEEAVAEDEAPWEDNTQTVMDIPHKLVPAVRKLLASQRG